MQVDSFNLKRCTCRSVKDWRQPRNETERLYGATETSEQSEKAKRGRTRHAVQTASERQATSQWKNTRECGAETLRREKRGTGVER